MILVVLAAIVLIYILEGPTLVKNRQWKELITLTFLLGVSLLLAAGRAMGIFTPMEYIGTMLNPLGKALLGHTEY